MLRINNNVIRDPGIESDAVEIIYKLIKSGDVKIRVFNILGELVKVILDQHVEPGNEEVEKWLGTNDDNEIVASGVYYINIQADGNEDTKKAVVIK